MDIEFHQLDIAGKKFEEVLEMLLKQFYVAHTHGNNSSKQKYKTNLPDTLELTFINKKLVSEEIKLSEKKYPIIGLDFPCNILADDYELIFKNNKCTSHE